MSDRDDDELTPPRQSAPRWTDSERRRAAPVRGVPVVGGPPQLPEHDQLIEELFERPPSDRELRIINRFRQTSLDPMVLVTMLARAVHRFERQREESDEQRGRDISQLRDLLTKPPNGAVKALQEQVGKLAGAVSELAVELEQLRTADTEREEQIRQGNASTKALSDELTPFRSVKRWVAASLVTVVAGSALWLWHRSESETTAAIQLKQNTSDIADLKKTVQWLIRRIVPTSDHSDRNEP